MIKRIISGGQTGVDQAALAAARDCGIETGGYVPAGYKTRGGVNFELRNEYGLCEAITSNYAERTALNVAFTDATLRVATNFSSAGEKCTLRCIERFKKPYADIDPTDRDINLDNLHAWLYYHNVSALNIAGNSSQTSPGIYKIAYDTIVCN